VRLQGEWTKYECGADGTVKAFKVHPTAYPDLLKRCQAKGFKTAQPANDLNSISWNPFQTNDDLNENLKKDIKNVWSLKAKMAVKDCKATEETDNIGNLYYTTFLTDTSGGVGKNQIMLATDSATAFPVTVTTRQGNGQATSKDVNIDNKQVYVVDITVVDNRPWKTGVKLSAKNGFVAYSMHVGSNSADGTLLLPQDVLSNEYRVIGAFSSQTPNSYIYVVVTTDNTNIIVNDLNGQHTYKGNELDVIPIPYGYDPSGTKVTSSAPIAVISGNGCLNFPSGCGYCDNVYEQLAGVNTQGLEFALVPFSHSVLTGRPTCCRDAKYCAARYEIYKVLALYDGTTITVTSTNTETYNLNAGKYQDLFLGLTAYGSLKSNKPVMVAHLMTGSQYAGEPSDPAFATVIPNDSFARNYFIASCNNQFTEHYVVITINTAQANALQINGKAFLTDVKANAIPGSSLSSYQYKLPCGKAAASFRITHPDKTVLYGVSTYGKGKDISYAFLAGRSVKFHTGF